MNRLSSPAAKIALFRELFCGREDAYAVRWTSTTSAGREFHAGLYPMLTDDTCRLLACDFDGGD